jgi:hypothetical protein
MIRLWSEKTKGSRAMERITEPQAWVALITVTALEIVLGTCRDIEPPSADCRRSGAGAAAKADGTLHAEAGERRGLGALFAG